MVANSAPRKGRAVEGPIGVLDQRIWVCAIRGAFEGVQRSRRAGCPDFEDRPTVVLATAGCPVEVAIAGLDQPRSWNDGERAVEAVQRGQRTPGVILKSVPQPGMPV